MASLVVVEAVKTFIFIYSFPAVDQIVPPHGVLSGLR